MGEPRASRRGSGPVSLLLVEGPTERVFYQRVRELALSDVRNVRIETIEGLFNVNRKILDLLLFKYRGASLRAYCCLDRESRYAKTPQFDLDQIRREIRAQNARYVLGIDAIIATQMLESWFFHDIEGIFRYLGVKRSLRNPKAYRPPEKFRKKDLRDLFRRNKKTYIEGDRAGPLIEALDVEAIVARCSELAEGVDLIRSQANDTRNYLFP